jgi:outer membrane receptor protein involved in Fe transport
MMYQDINVLPVQPQAQESSLPIVARSGPTDVSLNEFHPLFVRNGPTLQIDGALGNHDTWGNNLVAYGLHNRFSYSFGQFHYETNGFRENNDQIEDIYNAFVQVAVNPKLSVQAELRRRETEQGDLAMRFDPEVFSPTGRRNVEQDTGRFGIKYGPTRHSTFLGSIFYVDRAGEVSEPASMPGADPSYVLANDTDGYQSEIQYLFRGERVNLIAGGNWYTLDRTDREQIDWTPVFGEPCPSLFFAPEDCERSTNAQSDHKTGYAYVHASLPSPLLWTLGYSYDDVDEEPLRTRVNNPKVGLQWQVTPSLQVRAAYFETIKRVLVVEQTLEPTQVAGFTQVFDDFNGTEARFRGIGFDWKLLNMLFFGAQGGHRDVREPLFFADDIEYAEREVDAFEAYLYWAPHRRWALNATFRYEDLESDGKVSVVPENGRTKSLPLEVRYFDPRGLFGRLGATWVDQSVRYGVDFLEGGEDDFWVVDAALGYRLPKRRGILSLEVHNLFDQSFFYLDDTYRTADPVAPPFIPERTLVGKISLSF